MLTWAASFAVPADATTMRGRGPPRPIEPARSWGKHAALRVAAGQRRPYHAGRSRPPPPRPSMFRRAAVALVLCVSAGLAGPARADAWDVFYDESGPAT